MSVSARIVLLAMAPIIDIWPRSRPRISWPRSPMSGAFGAPCPPSIRCSLGFCFTGLRLQVKTCKAVQLWNTWHESSFRRLWAEASPGWTRARHRRRRPWPRFYARYVDGSRRQVRGPRTPTGAADARLLRITVWEPGPTGWLPISLVFQVPARADPPRLSSLLSPDMLHSATLCRTAALTDETRGPPLDRPVLGGRRAARASLEGMEHGIHPARPAPRQGELP